MPFETSEFGKTCRTCLTEEGAMHSLFSKDQIIGEDKPLHEMLMSFTSLKILENDGLPAQVCVQCVNSITQAFLFKIFCEKTDSTLREILEKHKHSVSAEVKLLPNDKQEKTFRIVEKTENKPPELFNFNNVNVRMNEIYITELPLKSEMFNSEDLLPKTDVKTELEENLWETTPDVLGSDSDGPNPKEDKTEHLYFCKVCNHSFTTKSELKTHCKTHPKSKPHFICKICHKVFSSASTLWRHREAHGKGKKFLCSECGKEFSRSDYLSRHIQSHTGEKPFLCSLCGKSFASSFSRIEHMRAHANEKSFICKICGKGFSRVAGLTLHKKTHTGVKTHTCKVCGKKLCGSNSLKIHMKIHTGVKDHVCLYCGKGFTTRGNLKVHEKVHR